MWRGNMCPMLERIGCFGSLSQMQAHVKSLPFLGKSAQKGFTTTMIAITTSATVGISFASR